MSSVIKLVLSDDEMEEARDVGLKRQALNRKLGVDETHGFGGDDGEVSVQGCLAGLGVARMLGLEWRGFLRSYKGTAEVGDDIVVRSTLLRRGNLILQLDDRDDWRYVLVRLHGLPQLEICGWVQGSDGKREGRWEDNRPPFDRRPCYLYPAWMLRPMDELMTEERQRGMPVINSAEAKTEEDDTDDTDDGFDGMASARQLDLFE
jgi:hypothetical protein